MGQGSGEIRKITVYYIHIDVSRSSPESKYRGEDSLKVEFGSGSMSSPPKSQTSRVSDRILDYTGECNLLCLLTACDASANLTVAAFTQTSELHSSYILALSECVQLFRVL